MVTGETEVQLLDRPIRSAASDGAGGVLFTVLDPNRFGPTWWLPAGAAEPQVVSEWDDPLIAALLDGQPVAEGPLPATGCSEEVQTNMVVRVLATGALETLTCGVAGSDSGSAPDSFGGGLYVGVEWDAVHPSGRSTDVRLVFRDEHGGVVDLPTNPYADDCSPCELAAALSPDGTRVAILHRPDAPPIRPDEYDDWLVSTASVEAELLVVDLRSGDLLFSRTLPAATHVGADGWFDGRFVVLGAATWEELDVPTTIIDTATGAATEVPGRVTLVVEFTDG